MSRRHKARFPVVGRDFKLRAPAAVAMQDERESVAWQNLTPEERSRRSLEGWAEWHEAQSEAVGRIVRSLRRRFGRAE
jgi:hypothetical protein